MVRSVIRKERLNILCVQRLMRGLGMRKEQPNNSDSVRFWSNYLKTFIRECLRFHARQQFRLMFNSAMLPQCPRKVSLWFGPVTFREGTATRWAQLFGSKTA
eukprot:PhF_6_TR26235/c0_g1_i2/m.37451